MEQTEDKQKKAELSQEDAPAQSGDPAAAAPDPQAQNDQKTQGIDLAHGNLSEAIASGESMTDGNDPYTAMNYYVEDEKNPRSAYFGLVNGRFITEYTFGELDALSPEDGEVNMTISYTDGDPAQNINGSLFALGKYQMVPSVRRSAMSAVGLSESSQFSPQNQDLCFTNYLIVEKRPAVMAYLTGESDDIEEAALEVAMEWAAVGVAPNEEIANGSYANENGLTSYYDGIGGNAASVSYEEIKAALRADRAAIESGGIATHTAVTSTDTPASIYPSSTMPPQAPPVTESDIEEQASANIDIDQAVTLNHQYGYSASTWVEIQRGIGMPESEIDGVVGPVTAQAIASWQASHGFTGDDIDGICGPMTLEAIRADVSSVSAAVSGDPVAQQVTEPPAQDPEPAPAPEPAPEPAPAQPEQNALLTPEEVEDALAWNIARDYAPETIILIQRSTGAPETGTFCAADMQKIAAWQKLYGLEDIDGKFGSKAMNVSTIIPRFNHSLSHYVGSTTPDWCTDHGFCNSQSLDDLEGNFRESAKKVINGIRAAGGTITINTTLRHEARAAVMNYCCQGYVTDEGQQILDKYDIELYGDAASRDAACDAFDILYPASLTSHHIRGHAVDIVIHSLPRYFECDGITIDTGGNRGDWVANADALNNSLRAYGVCGDFIWYEAGDEVHWSIDGY